jgi:sulfur-oxidizing protein SoxY
MLRRHASRSDLAAPRAGRRRALAAALALPAAIVSRRVAAQIDPLDPQVWVVTGGRKVTPGRVTLELPTLAENGNVVPMKVRVQSPMTAQDHVVAIHLFSERNPVRNMASFYLGPRAGRAEVSSRVRLARSQRVHAVAVMSDGTFWSDTREVEVGVPACTEGG